LVGDGWQVVRHDVPRHDTTHSEYPKQIKALIKADYAADPQNVKAVFIIGHVAVPYSGFLAPDEHDDHNGAWPADVYYGDMDGMWTDSYVTAQRATRSRNINLPGDGKFDQSYLPSNAELAVGRVDLADMTLFSKSELELTRQYLNKDHNFRAAVTRATAQALISDAFGDVTGGTADTAWRNFAPIIGTDKIAWGYWMDASPLQTYLWTYGSGSGWFEGCFGVGNAVDFDGNKSKVFFTLMFGSYFGDWNVPNNLLRAVIAQADYVLTAGWAGRPHWYFHPMALGETIGEGLRRSQNNDGTYQPTTNYVRGIHTALMGDPTLRMHIIAPPTNVVQIGNTLYWQPSTDAVLGYYVYSAPSLDGVFIQLNSQPVTQTSFSISANGASIYMVRAVRLESSPSGSYYNLSQGAFTANAQVTAQSYSTSAQLFLPAIYAQ
jgi:hypothetical protein